MEAYGFNKFSTGFNKVLKLVPKSLVSCCCIFYVKDLKAAAFYLDFGVKRWIKTFFFRQYVFYSLPPLPLISFWEMQKSYIRESLCASQYHKRSSWSPAVCGGFFKFHALARTALGSKGLLPLLWQMPELCCCCLLYRNRASLTVWVQDSHADPLSLPSLLKGAIVEKKHFPPVL